MALGLTLVLAALVASRTARAAEAPVDLGMAGSFVVLAGAGVTNTGPTALSGDLGTCPTPAITGFPPGGVSAGTIHADDAVACAAQSDLTTAYNDAAGRAPGTTFSGPTDLGGKKLTAGVYKSPTSLGITGTLTLDAEGDRSAVFLFQGGSTLVTAPNSRVALINGASACNVFWQVGSSATLGVGSTFVGSILASTSISANTNASVQGRLLARNGATTLDSNTVTRPACPAAASSTLTVEAPAQGLLTLRAGLTETASGAPIAGQTVVMSTSAGPACEAATDTAGMASCSGAGAAVSILAEGGYNASFAGDGRFLPTSARATLLGAGTGSSTPIGANTPARTAGPSPSSSVAGPGGSAITNRSAAGHMPATGDIRGFREWGLLLLALGGALIVAQAALRRRPGRNLSSNLRRSVRDSSVRRSRWSAC